MKFELKKLLLLVANAFIPGFGPLFYGISNVSVFGIISGLAILSAFAFVILIALNGEFFSYETHSNIFLALFHRFNGYKLERSLWIILFIIMLSTLALYGFIVYLSYKITLSLNMAIHTDPKPKQWTESCQTSS